MLATGFPTREYTTPFLRHYLDVLGDTMRDWQSVRRMGSAAADLAYVACGRFDGFFEIGLSPWDSAAGSLLIQEAGGTVTDFSGQTDFLYRPQVLATNGTLHERLIAAVAPLRDVGVVPFVQR
jgi:myo-inositol-1(or 4)-monophosphatase